MLLADVERPAAFDPDAYLDDLRDAGCVVVLSEPGTCFAPGDEGTTYFIRPGQSYCLVMAKWGDAIVSCPDHVAQVTARLAEMHGVNL